MPYYKVIRGEISNASRKAIENATKVVWEGTDVKELEKKFPRKYFTNRATLDQLRTVRMPKSTLATVFLTRETESEEWKPCDDPRSMIIEDPITKQVLVRTPAQIKQDKEEAVNRPSR